MATKKNKKSAVQAPPKKAPKPKAAAKAKATAAKAAPKAAAPKPSKVAATVGKPTKTATSPGKTAAAPATKSAPAATPTRGKPGSLFAAPIPPRSRLQAREPAAAEDLKAKLGALATAINQIRAIKRSIQRSFWDVGTILIDIRDRRLFVAKGYSSFENFLEREIELGKNVSLKIVRAVQLFQKEPAVAAGLDRVLFAVAAFDGELEVAQNTQSGPPNPTSVGTTRSPIPFHKQ